MIFCSTIIIFADFLQYNKYFPKKFYFAPLRHFQFLNRLNLPFSDFPDFQKLFSSKNFRKKFPKKSRRLPRFNFFCKMRLNLEKFLGRNFYEKNFCKKNPPRMEENFFSLQVLNFFSAVCVV